LWLGVPLVTKPRFAAVAVAAAKEVADARNADAHDEDAATSKSLIF